MFFEKIIYDRNTPYASPFFNQILYKKKVELLKT